MAAIPIRANKPLQALLLRIARNKPASQRAFHARLPGSLLLGMAFVLRQSAYCSAQQKLPDFTPGPWFGEQVREETTPEGIRVVFNAPAPAQFNAKRPTLLILYATPNGNTIEQTLGSRLDRGTDWHFDIQHIAAQTRRLREVDKDENIVLACVQAEERSWPAWRKKHADNAALIHALVETVRKCVPGAPVRVALAGHSGGGSFLFGFLNSADTIPAYVERIVYLDANYSYSDAEKHGDKLLAWLNGNRKRHLIVLAYDDRNITLDGKPVNGPDGGTYRATHRMLETFARHAPLVESAQGDVARWEGLQGRCLFVIHTNPANKILHATLVGDMNGFLMAMTQDTKFAATWGTFGSPRAYTDWIQPAAPAPKPAAQPQPSVPQNSIPETQRSGSPASAAALEGAATASNADKTLAMVIPPRFADAPGGKEVMARVADMPLADRENYLFEQITTGNLPDFMRRFKRIRVTAADSDGNSHTAVYEVMPDYLAVGSDGDFVRVPLTPMTANRIADRFGCALLTRKMVDDIYTQAELKFEPRPMTMEREAVKTFVEHNAIIEMQRQGKPLGLLVAGIKKDVVQTLLLLARPNRVAIYGWHKPDGKPIQPLTTVHRDTYVDYSHGIRLVRQTLLVDGKPTTINAVLQNPMLRALLSDEAP